VFGNLDLSLFLSFFVGLHSLITLFTQVLSLRRGHHDGHGCRRCDCRATLGPAPDGEPQTPEGVPEDVVESEGEPEVAPEPVLEVVQEEAPAEGP
jgi:hypothetical protein